MSPSCCAPWQIRWPVCVNIIPPQKRFVQQPSLGTSAVVDHVQMTLVTSRVLTFINSSPCSDSWSGTCQIQIAICHVRLLWRMSSSRGLRRRTELTVMALSSFPGMTNFLSMIKKNHIVVVIKFNSGTLVKFTWHQQNFFSNKYWWFIFFFLPKVRLIATTRCPPVSATRGHSHPLRPGEPPQRPLSTPAAAWQHDPDLG